ncbi:MAG: glycosyltransferase [Bacteroidetes bacterium]|nr:glycosyltransferase [Bacteroidota bacterium]
MKTILYITYDGLTDQVGQSQILPYVIELEKLGYKFHILSCEKEHILNEKKSEILSLLEGKNIQWHSILFHSKPPIVAKLYDLHLLKKEANRICSQHKINIIHCRSYVAAEIGYLFKKKYGTRFLFDMRGFWVDERVDGGIWNKKSLLGKFLYKRYKRKEANYINTSDAIVSLTFAGQREIQRWDSYANAPITVIPCAADFSFFEVNTPEKKEKAKKILGVAENALAVGYLGSLGTWYMLPELLKFYNAVLKKFPEAYFIFLTATPAHEIERAAKELVIDTSKLIIKKATKKEVSQLVCAFDVSPLFIKPLYSKIASSPIKMGELSALGIPMIGNKIGDVEEIIQATKCGLLVDDFSELSFAKVVDALPQLLTIESRTIRINAQPIWDLTVGVKKYDSVYKGL